MLGLLPDDVYLPLRAYRTLRRWWGWVMELLGWRTGAALASSYPVQSFWYARVSYISEGRPHLVCVRAAGYWRPTDERELLVALWDGEHLPRGGTYFVIEEPIDRQLTPVRFAIVVDI